jgi:hypothetical protein
VAREAVANFLRDESAAADERDARLASGTGPEAKAGGAAVSGIASRAGARESDGTLAAAPPASGQLEAQDMVLQAAAISVATLDRIEAAAAKLETDIAAALTEQAELHAGAGSAAEKAVRAAEAAWKSAGTAEEASGRAKALVRRAGRYVSIAVVLLLLQVLVIVLFASAAH